MNGVCHLDASLCIEFLYFVIFGRIGTRGMENSAFLRMSLNKSNGGKHQALQLCPVADLS